MVERCIEEQFMGEQHRGIWSFISEPSELIAAIEGAEEWGADAITFAKA